MIHGQGRGPIGVWRKGLNWTRKTRSLEVVQALGHEFPGEAPCIELTKPSKGLGGFTRLLDGFFSTLLPQEATTGFACPEWSEGSP